MVRCSVVTCKNRSQVNKKCDGITYHVFPRIPIKMKQWIKATGQGPNWTPENQVICSAHFEEKCFKKLKLHRRLFCWAIPTLGVPKVTNSVSTQMSEPIDPEKPGEITKENRYRKAITRDATEKNKSPKQKCLAVKTEDKKRCPECNMEIDPAAAKFEDRTKTIIARVYHFLKQEYEDMKQAYKMTLDLTPLKRLLRRTSDATGVSIRFVRCILEEEKNWYDGLKKDKEKLARNRWRIEPSKKMKTIPDSEEDVSDEEINQQPTETQNLKKDGDTPVEVIRIISDEEYYKAQNVGLQSDDGMVTIKEGTIEFDFHELNMESSNTSMINQSSYTQIDPEPIVITDQSHCRMDTAMNSMLGQPTVVAIESQQLVATDHCGMDGSMGSILGPPTVVAIESRPIVTTDQQHCGMDGSINTMMGQPDIRVIARIEAQPLVTDQHCGDYGMDGSMNTMIGQPFVTDQYCGMDGSIVSHIKAQPLVSTEPQYYSSGGEGNLMRLQRHFTDGVNYYVLM